MNTKWILFILTALFLSNSFASDVHLLVWRPTPDSPAYVLPQKRGETPQQAVERYRAFLFAETGLKAVAPPTMFVNGEGEIRDLSEPGAKSLFIANHENDHIDGSKRFNSFQGQLPSSENFLLPLGALGRLSKSERAKFHAEVANRFSGLILMGGDDVTPSTYGEEKTYAREFNLERDMLEIELIQAYVKAGKGFVFGVCRGLQITAVALGLKIKYQDIPIEAEAFTKHAGNDHESFQRRTPHHLLESFLGGAQPFSAYSWHHQATGYEPNPYLVLAAISPEGITEALEFANGKGLLTQSHPELTRTAKGRRIMKGVDSAIRANAEARSCRKALSF